MVKKLFRHEMIALWRTLLPVELILLAISVFVRVFQLFESDHTAYGVTFGISVFFLVMLNLINLVVATYTAVVRFYKNLFTAEGYLSFTLPVTPAQHIFAKLLAALVSQLAAVCVTAASISIATAGDVFYELMQAFGYGFHWLKDAAQAHLVWYIVEAVAVMLVAYLSQVLLLYACVCVGQLSRKNRVGAAVGAYFVHTLIVQILTTIWNVVLGTGNTGEETVVETAGEILPAIHVIFGAVLLWTILVSAIYFVIAHTIMRKKLNLE